MPNAVFFPKFFKLYSYTIFITNTRYHFINDTVSTYTIDFPSKYTLTFYSLGLQLQGLDGTGEDVAILRPVVEFN